MKITVLNLQSVMIVDVTYPVHGTVEDSGATGDLLLAWLTE